VRRGGPPAIPEGTYPIKVDEGRRKWVCKWVASIPVDQSGILAVEFCGGGHGKRIGRREAHC